MKVSKTIFKRNFLVVVFVIYVSSITLILSAATKDHLTQNSQITEVAGVATKVEKKEVRPGLPMRLKIKKINVDAVVTYVGLTTDGSMDTPKNPNDVAWLKSGQRPGEEGTAAITGHYGWIGDKTAVFDDLSELKKGDTIKIEDSAGTTITFVVRKLSTYGPNDDATDVFRSNDGKVHLNLITCQGDWNKSNESYSSRLVVFADKQ